MGSSGKKKTTMAKLARENRLRERRMNKQAKKDARRQAPPDRLDAQEIPIEAAEPRAGDLAVARPAVDGAAPRRTDDGVLAVGEAGPEPSDPRAKEVALDRLRDAPDEELAVFEGQLRDDALRAGATEQEMRDAQRTHPEHGS